MTRAIFLSAAWSGSAIGKHADAYAAGLGGPVRRRNAGPALPLLDRLAREYLIVALPVAEAAKRQSLPLEQLARDLSIELSASWLVASSAREASVFAGASPAPRAGALPARLKGVVAAGGSGSTAALHRALLSIERALIRGKVFVDLDTARDICADFRRKGRSIVFTNGVFDLFHLGHLRLIQSAREHGDALVVGLNSDESARGLKGHARPIIPQFARAEIVAGLAAVDLCVIFPQLDPRMLLRALRPDVLAKGSEYTLSRVVGRRFVQSYGGRVVLVPHLEGYSTSTIAAGIDGRSRT